MAHTLTKSSALVTLTVSSTSTFYVDDFIVGSKNTDSTANLNEAIDDATYTSLTDGVIKVGNYTSLTDGVIDTTAYTSLTDGEIDDIQTDIDVDDGSEFTALDYIRIDDEYMYIDSISSNTLTVTRGALNTTKSEHIDDSAIYVVQDELDVDNGADFTNKNFIKINDEYMKITNISSNTLTVTRAVFGTIATTHIDNSTISGLPIFDVDDGSEFSEGDYIKIDTEYMLITEIDSDTLVVTKGTLNTTSASHVDNSTIYVVELSFDVTDGTQFSFGDYIKIDSETMLVGGVSSNTLTVLRGQIGTVAVPHSTSTDIYIHNSTGFIAKKVDSTHIAVYEMTTTAFNPTETITTTGGVSTSCTGTGAYATGDLSADACLVEGSDSSVTNIFRQIADVASISGVSNPSSTQTYLGLDIQIYIGRKGQYADTVALTQEECVVLGATGNLGCLRIIGDSSHSSTLINGTAKYLDDDTDNFPPLYTERGSCIKFDNGSQLVAEAFTINTYGKFYNYRATLEGDDTYNGVAWNLTGEVRMADVSYLKWGTFFAATPPAKMYFYNLYIQGGDYAWSLMGLSPVYSSNIFWQNNSGDFLYAWASNFETTINGLFTYNSNGSVISGTQYLVSLGVSYIVLHCINSDTDITQLSSFFGGTYDVLKENTFKLTVVDSAGNPIENAVVNLEDENGGALYSKLAAVNNAVISAVATTVKLSPDNSEVSVGDTLRIGSDKFLISAKPNATDCTVSRSIDGTTAHLHGHVTYGYTFDVYKKETALTDSNGQIEYNGSGTKAAIATEMAYYSGSVTNLESGTFTLTVSKEGYETYRMPLEITGYNGIDMTIKLRHSLTAGRDAMAESFR